jgi:hypothetical protein
MKAKYALEGASQIVADLDAIEALGICPVLGDYLEDDGVARHATGRLTRDLLSLVIHPRYGDPKCGETGTGRKPDMDSHQIAKVP